VEAVGVKLTWKSHEFVEVCVCYNSADIDVSTVWSQGLVVCLSSTEVGG